MLFLGDKSAFRYKDIFIERLEKNMEQIWEALVGGTVGGGGVGAIALIIIKTWLNNLVNEKNELKKAVAELKDTRIVNLEKKLESHLDDDESGEVLTELKTEFKHINGTLNKIADKVDRLASDSSGQGARIEGLNLYVKNLDNSFQHHKETHHA